MSTKPRSRKRVAMVFAGGIGLGAYQAGAYEALARREDLELDWIAGSSVGAVNGALIAGVPEGLRLSALREFWTSGWQANPSLADLPFQSWGHTRRWLSALQGRFFGVQGQFRPRWPMSWDQPTSLYDLGPMRRQLSTLIDFDRVNSGSIRLSVASTDIQTGELVLFDNRAGDQIRMEHIEASCGLLPDFSPLDIDGRLLGDGGLSANAPVEAIVREHSSERETTAFIVDLYAREGDRPDGLASAMARRIDLLFANQTWLRLEAVAREHELRERLLATEDRASADGSRLRLYYLSYRAPPEEAGPAKPFDLSQQSVEERWRAGVLDMEEALRQYDRSPAQVLTPIRRR